MPHQVCFINIFMKNVFAIQVALFFNGIVIFKYICIFVLKNPTGLQDEFWSLFVWRWVLAFSFISQFVMDFFPGRYSLNYLICIGKESVASNSNETKIVRNNAMIFAAALSDVICTSLYIRIKMFKVGIDKCFGKDMSLFFSQRRFLESLEKQSITDYLTSIYFALYFCVTLSVIYIGNSIDKTKVNQYPFYLYIYFIQLCSPLFFCLSLCMLYYFRHHSLRRVIFKEIRILYCAYFEKNTHF